MDRVIALFPGELPAEDAAHLLHSLWLCCCPGELGRRGHILAGPFWWPRCLPGHIWSFLCESRVL